MYLFHIYNEFQVQELDSILSQDRAVLQKDGSFNVQSSSNVNKNDDSDNDNVIQISDDDDSDDGRVPKCKICKKYYIYFCNFWDLEV